MYLPRACKTGKASSLEEGRRSACVSALVIPLYLQAAGSLANLTTRSTRP